MGCFILVYLCVELSDDFVSVGIGDAGREVVNTEGCEAVNQAGFSGMPPSFYAPYISIILSCCHGD